FDKNREEADVSPNVEDTGVFFEYQAAARVTFLFENLPIKKIRLAFVEMKDGHPGGQLIARQATAGRLVFHPHQPPHSAGIFLIRDDVSDETRMPMRVLPGQYDCFLDRRVLPERRGDLA